MIYLNLFRRLGRGAAVALATLGATAPVAPAAAQAPSSAAASAARTDLYRAIQRDDARALRNALGRGADPNGRDESGEPVIVTAARIKSWGSVRALAEVRDIDLDAIGRAGATALMYAALHGEMAVARDLIGRDAQVNKTGWTPLHWAATNGHVEMVRLLLEHHAYIDAESPNGTTPLMMAARQGQPTTAELLLEEGADPTPRNQSGFTAAAYAKAAGNDRLAQRLTEAAATHARQHPRPAAPGR